MWCRRSPSTGAAGDAQGGTALHWEGAQASAPRGLTAHVDTLGAMVQWIKDNGRLQVVQLGGWAPWSTPPG